MKLRSRVRSANETAEEPAKRLLASHPTVITDTHTHSHTHLRHPLPHLTHTNSRIQSQTLVHTPWAHATLHRATPPRPRREAQDQRP